MDYAEKIAIRNKQAFALKGRIMTPEGIQSGAIAIEQGTIKDIRAEGFSNMHTIDLGHAFIVPGFVDLHMHGIHQYLIDNGLNDLQQICRIVPQYGITSFLPTVAPRKEGEDAAFLQSIAGIQSEGANILGFHLEGPFLKLTGSLSANAVAKADPKRVKALIDAIQPYRAIFSISPDLENITDIIPMMTIDNTPVFMTHTAANVEQAQAAIELGARHATHFYDVFPCPPVTEPGVRPCGIVEAILADERVSVDFILDGVHVEPIAVKMAMVAKAKGPGSVCLITDSNIGAGLHPGRFVFGDSGEIEFAYKGSPARKTIDNTLAGSGLTMDQAVRNAIQFLEIDLFEAVTMASLNPAKVIGADDRKGKLLPGYDADLVIMDEQHHIVQTIVAGEIKYTNVII
jgi:N-acetylglucosamine-6-phosphate deacetylase